ncbi:MAG: PQQ-like beta-propeller repeat protein [Sandaracinaceae bacterium]|nr:PQQ-like beta-propeller repeat protein [Sandaracinaceae bacterium]
MTTPLVLLNRRTLLALEPLTGVLRWQVPLEDLPTRLFVTDHVAFVAVASASGDPDHPGSVTAVSLASGAVLGTVPLPFGPSAGLVHEGHLYLAGRRGAACLTEQGTVRWVAENERAGGLAGVHVDGDLVAHDASGRELWRVDRRETSAEARPGLAIGAQVAQPDLR